MHSFCRVALAVLLLAAPAQARVLVNGINAVVNDAVITYQEVEEGIAPLINVLIQHHAGQPQLFEQRVQQLRAERLEELIERQLVLQEFNSAGYNLPESFVDDAIEKQIRREYGDRATLTLTLQARGIRFEQFRQQLREQIIVNEMRRFHVSPEKIMISPTKIETYYNENKEKFLLNDRVRLRMIAINKGSSRSPEAALHLAREIRSKLDEGTRFEDMAAVYSDGPQRAQGGDRGWVERDVFREEISNAAFSLPAGAYSEVIDLPEACYLVKVEETMTSHVRPLEQVRAEVEESLRSQEAARLYHRWITRLREKSFVRYY